MMSWSVLVGTGVRGVGYSRDCCCCCGARNVGDCGDCRGRGSGGDLLSEDDDGVEGQLGESWMVVVPFGILVYQ